MGGAGADAANESISITGAQGRSQDFGAGNEEDLQSRIEEFRQRAQAAGLIPGGQRKAARVVAEAASAAPEDLAVAARSPSDVSAAASTSISRTASSIFPTTTHPSTRSPTRSLASKLPKPATTLHASEPTPAVRSTFRTFSTAATSGFSSRDGTARAAARPTTPIPPCRRRPSAQAISQALHIMMARRCRFSILPLARSSASTASSNVINPALISPQARALLAYIPLPNLDTHGAKFSLTSPTTTATPTRSACA